MSYVWRKKRLKFIIPPINIVPFLQIYNSSSYPPPPKKYYAEHAAISRKISLTNFMLNDNTSWKIKFVIFPKYRINLIANGRSKIKYYTVQLVGKRVSSSLSLVGDGRVATEISWFRACQHRIFQVRRKSIV